MDDDINKERIYPLPATIENTSIILDQMKKCVCKIESKNGDATAFFCYIPYLNKKFPVLMTNNHIINEEIIKESNIIRIIVNNKEKNIDMNEKRKIYTNVKYDTTIIEIKPEKDKINHFLEIDKNIFQEEVHFFNESIYTLHYQKYGKEQKASVSYGLIKKTEDNYNLKYYCHVESASAGAPILTLLNNKLIGIHSQHNKYKLNNGILLKYPIYEYLNDFNLVSKVEIFENKKDIKKNKSKYKNEIYMLIKISKEDINKNIYFLDNSIKHNYLREINETNTDLYINDIKFKYKKYFSPKKDGVYYLKLKLKTCIKDCSFMFYNVNNLTNVDLSSFDSKNVNNMRYMFSDCNNLESIEFGNFNTKNVKDMSLMLYECSQLINIDFSSFEIENVEDFHWMLFNCNNLKKIKIKDDLKQKIKEELNCLKNLKIINE